MNISLKYHIPAREIDFLNVNLTKDGKFRNKYVTYAPFYQTDIDDYEHCKVLKIGGKKNESKNR